MSINIITLCSELILIFLQMTYGQELRTCNHAYPKPDEILPPMHLEHHHVITKRQADQSLRIKLYYDESVFKLSADKYNLIHTKVLPEAVSYWEKALMVRKTEKKIRLNRKCENNQIFLLRDDPHPYCKNSCEKITMCGEVQVPEEHLNRCRTCDSLGSNCRVTDKEPGEGITGADFVFYILAMETERCEKGSTVAYAAHCQQESALDRPIAGYANLCPSSISLKEQEIETLLSTVKHEILHALGFSVSLYAFYRDDDGQPLTNRTENGKPILNEQLQARQWSEKVIKKIKRENWKVRGGSFDKEVSVIVTPRVQKEVRKHFDCPHLEGAELEDQGGEGTVLTHWEKRIFENEAMTGTHTQNPVYSRITLALMEDTGWYRANYNLAQNLTWGSNLGCIFSMKSCKEWIEHQQIRGKSIHPFCNKVKKDPLETECADDRDSVGLCNLVRHPSTLPQIYQNFESIPNVFNDTLGDYGGSVSLADFCPYIQEFTWKSDNVIIRGSHCHFPENNPDDERNFALESYSNKSKCFNHKHEWIERTCRQMRHWQHWGSGCYEYFCADNRLHIVVANHTYTCYHSNQEISIEIFKNGWLHNGTILCPPCIDICQNCGEDVPPPRHIKYYYDKLVCSGCRTSSSLSLIIILLIYIMDIL